MTEIAELIVKAPAKINLHLEILPKRDDVYHNIISIFQMVSLYDIISFYPVNKRLCCIIQGDFPLALKQNIIYKTVCAFRRETGITMGLKIKVKKSIPLGGGLGGGSSDAAAVLRGLNRLFPGKLNREQTLKLAANMGSDVPFFLKSPTALVSGKGEIIQPLITKKGLFVVIIKPDFRIDTKEAYRWFDEEQKQKLNHPRISIPQLKQIYNKNPCKEWSLFNSFSGVLSKRFGFFNKVIEQLVQAGAEYAAISGSGSAVFALFSDDKEAKAFISKNEGKYNFLKLVKPLAKMPEMYYDAI